jgi:hypothetical protein
MFLKFEVDQEILLTTSHKNVYMHFPRSQVSCMFPELILNDLITSMILDGEYNLRSSPLSIHAPNFLYLVTSPSLGLFQVSLPICSQPVFSVSVKTRSQCPCEAASNIANNCNHTLNNISGRKLEHKIL